MLPFSLLLLLLLLLLCFLYLEEMNDVYKPYEITYTNQSRLLTIAFVATFKAALPKGSYWYIGSDNYPHGNVL
jgi:hypothetical protein